MSSRLLLGTLAFWLFTVDRADAEPASTVVPPVVEQAYKAYDNSKTLYARVKRTEQGISDVAEIWIERGQRTFYRDSSLIFEDRDNHFLYYYPYGNLVHRQDFEQKGRTSLQWLPPLLNIHFPAPSAAYGRYSRVTPSKYEGIPAWKAEGIEIADDGEMDVYFHKDSAVPVGWVERYPDGFTRSFKVEEWTWDDDKPIPDAQVPEDAVLAELDITSYLAPGRPFPHVDLLNADGNRVDIIDFLQGHKGAIITIGTEGCGPCELIKRWMHKHQDELNDADIQSLAIEFMTEEQFAKAIAKHKSPPHLLRADAPAAHRMMKVGGMPTNYFIDANAKVIAASQGYDETELDTRLKQMSH